MRSKSASVRLEATSCTQCATWSPMRLVRVLPRMMAIVVMVPPGGGVGRSSVVRTRRAGERSGVEIPDLVDALAELPSVRRALVAVVVDRVVQVRAPVAQPDELADVRAAGATVAVELDHSGVGGLDE